MKIKLKLDLDMYHIERQAGEPIIGVTAPAGSTVDYFTEILSDRRTRIHRFWAVVGDRKCYRVTQSISPWEVGARSGVWYESKVVWPTKLGLDRSDNGRVVYAKFEIERSRVVVITRNWPECIHWSVPIDEAYRVVIPLRDDKGLPIPANQKEVDNMYESS